MKEPTLDQEADAKDLVRRGYSIGQVGTITGVDPEWLEANWSVLTYTAPQSNRPKWVSAGERKRRNGWAR